jgi:PAS domain S-box-containing protein
MNDAISDDGTSTTVSNFLPGEGEMARAVNARDWAATPLGPVSGWPPCIRTAVSICLGSNFPIMVLVGPQLAYIYNDACIPIFGDKHPGALGRSVADVWPEAWETIAPVLDSVLETGKPVRHDDWRLMLNRSGFAEECFFTLSYSQVRCDADSAAGIFVAIMETTGRVLGERMLEAAKRELEQRFELRTEELREANQLLAAVFDRAPGGIAITDIDGSFVRANPAYQALVGVTEQALLGRKVADFIEVEDCAGAGAKLEALLGGATGSAQMEVRSRRADGSVIWVHNFVSIIADDIGRARYFVHIANDITERKRVEAGRRAAQDELNVLYQRLQTVREAERTALAREVHDQLGQILSAAKIDVKLLEGDLSAHGAALAPAKIITELRSAGATLDRAMQLVRDIATELRAPELDGQGLSAAIEWHARDFERRTRIQVHLELGAGLAQPARAAGEALLRIFHEALTNVLRHAHAGQVWVSLERRAGALLLRVRDDGAGIARARARGGLSVRYGRSLGITGMQERAALAHGRVVVGPLKPRGTLVSALIPFDGSGAGSGAMLGAHP